MPTIDDVKSYLADHGVQVRQFDQPTPTSEAAARAAGCTVGEIAKTLLFIVGGVPVVVVTAGDHKVRGAKLKRATGLGGKVRLPDGEQVREHTGYRPGGVCPFLLPDSLPVYVDTSLRRFGTVHPAAGDDHSGVPIAVDRLLELTGGSEVDVCEPL